MRVVMAWKAALHQQDSWNVELWPDPVETQALLQKISAKISKYVVLHPEAVSFSRHGYRAAQFEDAFARFFPHEPNIRTFKRGREGM